MSKNLIIIIIVAFIAVVAIVMFNRSDKELTQPRPNSTVNSLQAGEMVIVTEMNNMYHYKKCHMIQGKTKKMYEAEAKAAGVVICPDCLVRSLPGHVQ